MAKNYGKKSKATSSLFDLAKSVVIGPGNHVGLMDNNTDGAEGTIPIYIYIYMPRF